MKTSSSAPRQALCPHMGAASAWKKRGFLFLPEIIAPSMGTFIHLEENLFLIHTKVLDRSARFFPHPALPRPFLDPFGNTLFQS